MRTELTKIDIITNKLKSEIKRICRELNTDNIIIKAYNKPLYIEGILRRANIFLYWDETKLTSELEINIEDYVQDYFIPKYLYIENHIMGYALINKQKNLIRFSLEILSEDESLYWVH